MFILLSVLLFYMVHVGLRHILSRFLPMMWKDPHLFFWKWLSSYINTICYNYYSLFYWIVSAPFSKLTVCTCMGILSKISQYAILPAKNLLVRLSDNIGSIQSFCECVHDFRYAHIHDCNLVVSWNDVGDFQRKPISNKWISTFCSFFIQVIL